MNEYTFFEAAAKAKVGETLQNVSWGCKDIVKGEDWFFWRGTENVVELDGEFLNEKWIIVEEAARYQMEMKMKAFVAGLSEEERERLRQLMDAGKAFNVGIKE